MVLWDLDGLFIHGAPLSDGHRSGQRDTKDQLVESKLGRSRKCPIWLSIEYHFICWLIEGLNDLGGTFQQVCIWILAFNSITSSQPWSLVIFCAQSMFLKGYQNTWIFRKCKNNQNSIFCPPTESCPSSSLFVGDFSLQSFAATGRWSAPNFGSMTGCDSSYPSSTAPSCRFALT